MTIWTGTETMHSIHKILTALAAFALTIGPAAAHHPLAGAPMETFAHGLLSGAGHPLLGFDHLFFAALVGVAAACAGRIKSAPAAYIAAMLAGCALAGGGAVLPGAEVMIALSLLAVGGVVAWGRKLNLAAALALFAGFGVFHGAAFGGALAAYETAAPAAVLGGYLLGLGVMQYVTALGGGYLTRAAVKTAGALHSAAAPRIAGAMAAGAGLYLTLEHAEGAALQMFGWAG
ncbi:MAG: HupE/UreJ family protein [Rhodospirillales bacterium]